MRQWIEIDRWLKSWVIKVKMAICSVAFVCVCMCVMDVYTTICFKVDDVWAASRDLARLDKICRSFVFGSVWPPFGHTKKRTFGGEEIYTWVNSNVAQSASQQANKATRDRYRATLEGAVLIPMRLYNDHIMKRLGHWTNMVVTLNKTIALTNYGIIRYQCHLVVLIVFVGSLSKYIAALLTCLWQSRVGEHAPKLVAHICPSAYLPNRESPAPTSLKAKIYLINMITIKHSRLERNR